MKLFFHFCMSLRLRFYCNLLIWHALGCASTVFLCFHLDGNLFEAVLVKQDIFLFSLNLFFFVDFSLMGPCFFSLDSAATGPPSVEAVCTAVSWASCPGACAPCGWPLYQNCHDNMWADHQEGLRPGFRGIPHACGCPPYDEKPDCWHGHDNLPRASAHEHRHQPEEQFCCCTKGELNPCTKAWP